MVPSGGWDYGLLAQQIGVFLSEPLPYSVVLVVFIFFILGYVRRALARIIMR